MQGPGELISNSARRGNRSQRQAPRVFSWDTLGNRTSN